MCAKKDFYIFVQSDLNLRPLDLKFGPLVTLVQRYVSTKLKVSTVFLFRKKSEVCDGQTGGRLMRSPREGRSGTEC